MVNVRHILWPSHTVAQRIGLTDYRLRLGNTGPNDETLTR